MKSNALDTVAAERQRGLTRAGGRWLARRGRGPAARAKIVKLGPVAALLRPVGLAVALVLASYGLVSLGTTFWRSYERHIEHSRLVHPDRSVFDILLKPSLPADAVDLVVRDVDGRLRRLVASRSQADAFVNDTILMLDGERDRIKAAAAADIERVFGYAFADRDQAVEAYADWFFEWKRSYIVLKETLTSTATRLLETGKYESLSEAVERDVKDYFMRHYVAQVLKPEVRDRKIVQGLEAAVRQAHDSYRRVIANGDLRLQLFLARHTTHMADVAADRPVADIRLDWDAQKWKAPTYLMEDRAVAGIAGLGQAAAGGTVGALVLGPAINRSMGAAFGALSRRFAVSMGTRLAFAEQGAVAGGIVQPVGGQVVGAVAGVLVGFAADYFISRAQEGFNREQFLAANHEALDATIADWKGRLTTNVEAAIDRWFDDARASIVLSRD